MKSKRVGARTGVFFGAAAMILMCALATVAYARGKSGWVATHTIDPLTDQERCVVGRYDRIARVRFSRTGLLYAVVENHPEHGLLVGASSGGRVRLPVGDVIWRIDDNRHHVLLAKNTPLDSNTRQLVEGQAFSALNEEHAEAMKQALKGTMGMISTSTFATGEQAREMLREMMSGSTLLFRAQAVASNIGLPDANTARVGEFRKGSLKPIPLDESFRTAIRECGIDLSVLGQKHPTSTN